MSVLVCFVLFLNPNLTPLYSPSTKRAGGPRRGGMSLPRSSTLRRRDLCCGRDASLAVTWWRQGLHGHDRGCGRGRLRPTGFTWRRRRVMCLPVVLFWHLPLSLTTYLSLSLHLFGWLPGAVAVGGSDREQGPERPGPWAGAAGDGNGRGRSRSRGRGRDRDRGRGRGRNRSRSRSRSRMSRRPGPSRASDDLKYSNFWFLLVFGVFIQHNFCSRRPFFMVFRCLYIYF